MYGRLKCSGTSRMQSGNAIRSIYNRRHPALNTNHEYEYHFISSSYYDKVSFINSSSYTLSAPIYRLAKKKKM